MWAKGKTADSSTTMNILYFDEDIIVVDKPGGLLAVPGRGIDKQDCVVNRVRQIFPDLISQPAVHRLDMYTSGVMVLGRTKEAHRNLSIQFEQRIPQKKYVALLEGEVQKEFGIIELRFRLDPLNRPLQIYDPVNGKEGITNWRKLSYKNKITRVEFIPLTGRTHQLRVHAAHPLGLGCPIQGDYLYGNGNDGDQMKLHAYYLKLQHPVRKEGIEFYSEPPF